MASQCSSLACAGRHPAQARGARTLLVAVVSAVGAVAEEAAASGAEQAARAAAAAAAKVAVRHEYFHQASKLVLHSTLAPGVP